MNNIVVDKEIDGVIYRARYKGIAFSIELSERLEDDNSSFRLAEILFREILVSPKVEIDDFEDIEAYSRVFAFLWNVANGVGVSRSRSKSKLKQRARENWSLWRLVLSNRGFDYQTVFGKPYMTPQDVMEANFALDMQLEAEKRAAKKK